MIIKLYTESTSDRELKRISEVLQNGGVVIYPTDSVYAIGCAVSSIKSVERLRALSGKDSREMSLIFDSISSVAEYCKVDNAAFKLLKRNTPAPITFILKSLSRLPDKILGKRKTIGVRIPDNRLTLAIVSALGEPMLSASLKNDVEEEYLTDPELIEELWGTKVDCVVDGGIGNMTPSMVVDLSGGEIEIIREGEVELKL